MNAIAERFYRDCVVFHQAQRQTAAMFGVRNDITARRGAYRHLLDRHAEPTVVRHVPQIAGVLDRLEERARREAQEEGS
ncbi:MAG: hypothetical protein GX657_15405 [Chloroflexi bacterium]|nr:hypothetical protein [Chloroflexota bacterium]